MDNSDSTKEQSTNIGNLPLTTSLQVPNIPTYNEELNLTDLCDIKSIPSFNNESASVSTSSSTAAPVDPRIALEATADVMAKFEYFKSSVEELEKFVRSGGLGDETLMSEEVDKIKQALEQTYEDLKAVEEYLKTL